MGRFKVFNEFRAVDKMSRVLKKMGNNVKSFGAKTSRVFDKVNQRIDIMGAKAKRGFRVFATGALIVGGALTSLVTTGAEFEQSLINAAAKFPGAIKPGTAAFIELNNAAREVGRTTEFTASQSAEALNFLAMAGFNAKQSVAALPGVVNLATTAQIDLARATDIATDTLGAFNLMTDDTTKLTKNLSRVNDVLAKTATSSNTTLEQMFEAFKEVGPVAASMGANIETTSALLGKLGSETIKGTRAGTTLKNMFIRLSAPSAGAAKILKKLGVETKDAKGNFNDINMIIGQLNKGLSSLGSADRAAVLNEIFGRIPIAGVNVLLSQGQEKLDKYRDSLNNAAGASQRMAEMMRSSTLNRFKELNSAIESVKITIFSTTKGPLNEMIQKTTEWVRANENLIATKIADFIMIIFDSLSWLATNAEKIFRLTSFVFGLIAAFKILTGVLTVINLVMAANPVVLIIMGIIAALALLYTYWDEISEFFSTMWDGFIEGTKLAWEWIKKIGSGIVDFLINPLGTTFELVTSLFSDDDENASETEASNQNITTGEVLARQITENNERTTSEVVINDNTDRAEATSPLPSNIRLISSGGL